MTQEPKSRSPRIEIRPELWPALQVEAITRHMSPKDLVNALILESISPKAREFMEPDAHEPITMKITREPDHEPEHRTVQVIREPEQESAHITAQIVRKPDTTTPRHIATKEPMSPQPHDTKCGAVPAIEKRKRLADNPDALEQIKALWSGGLHNGTEIAKRIGYPKATVAENIKRLKEKGELSIEMQ